jgi:hypothetical protein
MRPPEALSGIIRGEISSPALRNAGSNSNDEMPVVSSHATAPATLSQIFTNAVDIIYSVAF